MSPLCWDYCYWSTNGRFESGKEGCNAGITISDGDGSLQRCHVHRLINYQCVCLYVCMYLFVMG